MASFRERLMARQRLCGTFVKTPAPHLVELCAIAGCDFVAPDMEHAPIDLATLDLMLGFAGAVPVLPRLPGKGPGLIGGVLDAGATGVLVPHVSSPEEADASVAAARFGRGQRGFSPSPRAGRYGAAGAAAYLERAEVETVLAVQIEDRAGLEAAHEIARVSGVDALFVGPVDLSMSLGLAPGAPGLGEAIARIGAAGAGAGRACGIFVPNAAAAERWAAAGFTWFIIGSEQSHFVAALGAATQAIANLPPEGGAA